MEEALGIAAAVLKSTTGSSLLKGILPELTIVWQDKETGVWCKGRIDALNVELGILLDLKTLSDPLNDQSLMKLVYLRKYYRQLAWYAMGLEALGRPVDLSVLIWVQKKLPYPVRFCSLNQTALETGKHEMLSGEWPSYDGEVTSIGLPAWVKTETIVEERTEEMTHAA
jgi:hypothetical protein